MKETNEIIKDINRIKALTEDILEYQDVDVDKGYRKVAARIQKREAQKRFMQVFSRVAVFLLVPLSVTSLLFSYLYWQQREQLPQITYNQVMSAPGTVTQLQLPDQTTVWLNAGSTLRYPSSFTGEKREVQLSGEGYFEVESDREHPFYVNTPGGIQVMAYGTRFNVNAYEDEPTIEAVLERGKIDVISRNKTVQLIPDKQAVFDKSTQELTVSSANLDETTGWKEGRLVFRNTPLDVVLKKLAKRYNVDIVLHNDGKKAYKYRATFTTETVEQILNYLKLSGPIEWSVQEPRQNEDASFTKRRIDVYQK